MVLQKVAAWREQEARDRNVPRSRVLKDDTIYEIAQVHEVTEAAVWEILGRVARAAAGQGVEPVVTGGLGSDTTPGLTGGYGATGFGDIGNETPNPNPSEPSLSEAEDAEDE